MSAKLRVVTLRRMRKSIDFALLDAPPSDDDDLPAMSWIVGVADVFDDAVPRVFVVSEEQGRNGYGQTLYLTESDVRRLRVALANALREFGADPGA
jgi:hypothetical protein